MSEEELNHAEVLGAWADSKHFPSFHMFLVTHNIQRFPLSTADLGTRCHAWRVALEKEMDSEPILKGQEKKYNV